MRKFLVAGSALFALVSSAFAQPVSQSGPITPNTAAIWNGTGIIKGGVSATDSPLTTFGVTRDAVDSFCVSSARSTAVGRNQLCFQAGTSSAAKISLQNYGTASAQDLQFVLNGVTLTLPSGGGTFVTGLPPYVAGHAACFNSTAGIIQDCGVSVTSGTQFGVPYYSASSTLTSTGAATSGQLLIGQNAAAPLWTNLSGDASALSAGGALTLSKVNGIPFSTTYTAHGVLLGEGSSAFTSLATSNVGQCLLSQGSSADPIWSSCAAGAGSAGGSNTQVQFNNSTSLGGSVNFTWVSPALTLGVAGTTTGQLALAPAAGASGTVTVQNPLATSAYNFNLPTGAGSLGQPLLSGGGGSTAMTFGTLGVAGGGTGASSASGTALDNISGFASTGFVQRTGAGTYAFSTVISVSGGGTGLANGTSGGIPAFTGSSTMTSSALLAQYSLVAGGGAGAVPATITKGTAGQILIEQTAANPSWNTLSGDATINSAGALTIANSAVTVAKMANAAAYTLMGNFTGGAAAPQLSTMGNLTQKASPAAGDYLILQDNSASGQIKYATVSSVSSAGSVSSIAGNTGSFTLGAGLTNSTNVLLIDTTYFPNYISGLTLSNDSGTPNSVLDIAAGSAMDSTNATLFKIGAFTKSTAGAWTAGTGNNGMGNGLTIANSTWYHVCFVPNGGTSDIYFDTSATCANKPAGVTGTTYRRIGSFKTDGSAHILAFYMETNGDVLWAAPVFDYNAQAISASPITLTLSTPPGVRTRASMYTVNGVSGAAHLLLYSPDIAAQTPSATANNVGSNYGGGIIMPYQTFVWTNASSQIQAVSDTAAQTINVKTAGYFDPRGQ